MKTHTLPPSPLAIGQSLRRVWTFLVDLVNRHPDIRVWQRTNRFGEIGWHGYDPSTGDYVCFGTEDEIRSWIEQRYYTRH